jgi:hypothetical protein
LLRRGTLRPQGQAQTAVNDTRQIWIVTAHDSPTNDEAGQRLLLEKCRDLKETGMELYVWPILSVVGATVLAELSAFDATKSYAQVASIPLSQSEENEEDLVTTATEEWVQWLDSHYKKTRPAYRVPLVYPAWQERAQERNAETTSSENSTALLHTSPILLDFYNLQQTAKEPPLVPIHQETGKVRLGQGTPSLDHRRQCASLGRATVL